MSLLKALYKLISTISIIILFIWFVKWYIKGHTGKYAIWFWLYTIISIIIFISAKTNQPVEDTTPGYVYWERNVKNH
jgi:hypothetical protein